jgi:hypothetical protein
MSKSSVAARAQEAKRAVVIAQKTPVRRVCCDDMVNSTLFTNLIRQQLRDPELKQTRWDFKLFIYRSVICRGGSIPRSACDLPFEELRESAVQSYRARITKLHLQPSHVASVVAKLWCHICTALQIHPATFICFSPLGEGPPSGKDRKDAQARCLNRLSI